MRLALASRDVKNTRIGMVGTVNQKAGAAGFIYGKGHPEPNALCYLALISRIRICVV
ncbi:hypothetical protein [Pedobacter sp. KBW06]|uniref:hypothetical protein n=1 Tax=Pedobacter sp. KBW06 TaxID=2153359 RepID=UPI00131511E4|nr:hypothetical protein [Pedobacter sp. KBW06]